MGIGWLCVANNRGRFCASVYWGGFSTRPHPAGASDVSWPRQIAADPLDAPAAVRLGADRDGDDDLSGGSERSNHRPARARRPSRLLHGIFGGPPRSGACRASAHRRRGASPCPRRPHRAVLRPRGATRSPVRRAASRDAAIFLTATFTGLRPGPAAPPPPRGRPRGSASSSRRTPRSSGSAMTNATFRRRRRARPDLAWGHPETPQEVPSHEHIRTPRPAARRRRCLP
jgi:hypothetical protein